MARSIRFIASRIVGSAFVFGAVLIAAAPTAVAGGNISVSPSTASPSQSVTFSGNVPTTGSPSCDPTEAAVLTSTSDLFPPDGFGPQVARDASGNFTTPYTIPATTTSGTYTVGVRCGGGNVGASVNLDVASSTTSSTTSTTSTSTSTTSTTVASTTTTTTASSSSSSDSDDNSWWPWLVLAALVIIAIVVAVLIARRRRGGPPPDGGPPPPAPTRPVQPDDLPPTQPIPPTNPPG